MSSSTTVLPIKGSTRRALAGSHLVAAAESVKPIRVSLYARQNRAARIERAEVTARLSREFPKRRAYLSEPDFQRVFGADPADVTRIARWAAGKGLKVDRPRPGSRRITVGGTVPTINAAFGTTLNEYEHPTLGRFRGREGALHIDPKVYGLIEGIFGLDTRRVGRPRLRRLDTTPLPWTSFRSPAPDKAKLFNAYLNAGVDAAAKQQAETKFSAGVTLAMAVRDRALALLPPNA